MRVHTVSLAVLALGATLGLVVAQDRPARQPAPAAPGAAPTAAPQERETDVRAIRDLLAAFVKAYNSRDAKAIGNLFTPDAEIEDEDGAITRGRDAIVARFTGIFKESKGDELTDNFDSLRFLGTDVAIEEGTTTLSTQGAKTPPVTNHYSVIYARQGGRWLHARIRDEPPDDDPHDQLTDLEWMLGEWINESDDADVLTHCKWSKDGNFLLRDFEVKVENRIALSGTQRIGWDGQRKQFRTWVFDDRGGFAEGLMARDGDRWVAKLTGVRSDGQAVSLTSAITILGKDRLLWETFDRTLGGKLIPDTDRFTLVRQAPNPGK
jgi:uncharacterized protein (TIGR02246 family)